MAPHSNARLALIVRKTITTETRHARTLLRQALLWLMEVQDSGIHDSVGYCLSLPSLQTKSWRTFTNITGGKHLEQSVKWYSGRFLKLRALWKDSSQVCRLMAVQATRGRFFVCHRISKLQLSLLLL